MHQYGKPAKVQLFLAEIAKTKEMPAKVHEFPSVFIVKVYSGEKKLHICSFFRKVGSIGKKNMQNCSNFPPKGKQMVGGMEVEGNWEARGMHPGAAGE
ncbi:MAG: hypothetical protein K0R75_538 [Paenibacillaceae bacterium]|jgi:hypothetical protein|nr:hypothetical protein [Paenibacillaceae bacterium]